MCKIKEKWRNFQRCLITPMFFPSLTVQIWIFVTIGLTDFLSDAVVFGSAHKDFSHMGAALEIISTHNSSQPAVINVREEYVALSQEDKNRYCNINEILSAKMYLNSNSTYYRFGFYIMLVEIFYALAFFKSVLWLSYQVYGNNLDTFGQKCPRIFHFLELINFANINFIKCTVHLFEDTFQFLLLTKIECLFFGDQGVDCTVKLSQWKQDAWDDDLFKLSESLHDRFHPIYIFSISFSILSVILTFVSATSQCRRENPEHIFEKQRYFIVMMFVSGFTLGTTFSIMCFAFWLGKNSEHYSLYLMFSFVMGFTPCMAIFHSHAPQVLLQRRPNQTL